MRNLKIRIRNKTRKELFSSINELKMKFQKDALKLHETFANSRSIIQQKDREIAELVKKVESQEILITSMRLILDKISNPKEIHKEKKQENLENQIEAYKLQIKSIKILCEEFKNDFDKIKAENEKLIEENHQLKQTVENTVHELNNFSNEHTVKLKKEKEDISSEFMKYKMEAEKELEVRELLHNRQAQVIASLQEELKNAKLIINTPRIHYKAIERLKDLADKDFSEKRLQKAYGNVQKNSIYSSVRRKLPSNYSYKEYKAFNNEESRTALQALRAVSISPRIEFNGYNNSYSTESKHKYSKNSILYQE